LIDEWRRSGCAVTFVGKSVELDDYLKAGKYLVSRRTVKFVGINDTSYAL